MFLLRLPDKPGRQKKQKLVFSDGAETGQKHGFRQPDRSLETCEVNNSRRDGATTCRRKRRTAVDGQFGCVPRHVSCCYSLRSRPKPLIKNLPRASLGRTEQGSFHFFCSLVDPEAKGEGGKEEECGARVSESRRGRFGLRLL